MNIFSFDLDGTLLPSPMGQVPNIVYEKINYLLDKGNIVIFNSGRPFEILRKFMNPIKRSEHVYFSIDNGAALLKQDGTPLFIKAVPNEYLKDIQKNHPHINVFAYSLNSELVCFSNNEYVKREAKINDMPTIVIDMDTDLSNITLLKYLLCEDKEILDRTTFIYDDTEFTTVRTYDFMMEIIGKHADKAEAIEYVKGLYNDIDNIYVFGDSGNDISSVGKYFGIVPSNASNGVKKVAKYVASKPCYEGVLESIEHFHL